MIMKNLSEIVRCGNNFLNRKLKGQNSSASEQYLMMYLMPNSVVNQETIADYFMLDKGTVAKTLLKLEEKGFVTREENPENRREKRVCLTPLGRGQISGMAIMRDEWYADLFEGIDEEEIKAFNSTLEKLAENAKKSV